MFTCCCERAVVTNGELMFTISYSIEKDINLYFHLVMRLFHTKISKSFKSCLELKSLQLFPHANSATDSYQVIFCSMNKIGSLFL